MRRVFVTGVGAVTPLGGGFEESWKALLEARSGVAPLSDEAFRDLPVRIAGRVRGPAEGALPAGLRRERYDRFVRLALAAAREALSGAGLLPTAPPSDTAVIIGSGRGGLEALGRADRLPGRRAFPPRLMSGSTPYMAAGAVAMAYGLSGPSLGVSTACASGMHALGEGLRWIRHGVADRVLAGGAEAPVCRLALGGYAAAGALSRRNEEPEAASRPFCLGRDGFVLSEGATLLVLEDGESARRRGAPVLGELAGFGSTGLSRHETRPDPEAALTAMRRALDDAGIRPEALCCVSTHGTSTVLGDRVEAEALHRLFRDADGLPAVMAVKAFSGHMLAASAPFEVAVALRALREGRIPPARLHGEPDPACGIPVSVRPLRIGGPAYLLANAFGFGGASASVVLRPAPPATEGPTGARAD